jgi:hypothetical protein
VVADAAVDAMADAIVETAATDAVNKN